MSKNVGYILPRYSEKIRENTLFHYTSASGVLGILQGRHIWCTATHCSNDESEIEIGESILLNEFRKVAADVFTYDHQLMSVFRSRNVDPFGFAESFCQLIVNSTFGFIHPYITCFCKASDEDIFYNGLLSQWRAYGTDGGYAIQFNMEKIQNNIQEANKNTAQIYYMQDVYYEIDNPLKFELLKNIEVLRKRFIEHLRFLAKPITLESGQIPSPISNLPEGCIESLIKFLLYTKSHHFSEEREVRLVHLGSRSEEEPDLSFFPRNGLIIPYKKTNDTLNILECIDGIVIGPSSRMAARHKSLDRVVESTGMRIPIRKSKIPFTRN